MQWQLKKAIYQVMAIFLFFCGITPALSSRAQAEHAYKCSVIAVDTVQPQLIWLGTEGGIKSYHIKDKQWQWFPQVKRVKCLLVDKRNKNIIWAGTETGLFIFSREKEIWLPAKEYFTKLELDKKTAEIFQNQVISAIVQDSLHPKKVFLATAAGLVHFDREKEEASFLSVDDGLLEDAISCLAVDPHKPDLLWLGSNAGLVSLNVKEGKIARHLSQGEVSGDRIRTITVNEEWVLVNNPDGGIVGYHKEGDYWDFFVPYEDVTLDDYQVLSLYYSDYNGSSKLWVGTRTYGVLVFDQVTKFSSQLQQIGLNVTTFAWAGKKDDPVWFGVQVCSGGGVGQYFYAEKSWWLTYPMVNLDETYPVVWKEVQKDQQGF